MNTSNIISILLIALSSFLLASLGKSRNKAPDDIAVADREAVVKEIDNILKSTTDTTKVAAPPVVEKMVTKEVQKQEAAPKPCTQNAKKDQNKDQTKDQNKDMKKGSTPLTGDERDIHPKAKTKFLRLQNSEKTIDTQGPWFLGTCTGTKSSGAWMREWIELQIAVGVDHVWVADDNKPNSTDITSSVLKYYERIGYVTIIPVAPTVYPGCEQLSGPDNRHNCAPVKSCFKHASPHVKWLLFADTDEFIFPHNGCSLKEHIKNHCNPDATHIYVRWERFGTSGFETHPNGMMLENFLASGGTCDKRFNGHCAKYPYHNCPECRWSKVIYNTECAKVEHAGYIHWPVNTTDWKESKLPEYKKMQWVKSPGTGGNWKKETCQYTGLIADAVKCNKWAKFGGGSKRPKEYTPDCCTGGIGYNHYGTQSRQYYERKQKNKNENKRGWRAALRGLDLNDVLSFSVLKFVKAVRRRFTGLGAQVSDSVKFVDLKGGKEDGKSCFIETNWAYTPTETTVSLEVTEAKKSQQCCRACHQNAMCKAFTFVNSTCNLLIGADKIPRTEVKHNPYQVHANRKWAINILSGIPMREGICGV